jgi:N-acetylmuramoyl-L-alanine amidase
MPNPIFPGAVWDPGRAAGYNQGRNRMRSVKCHYTVGRNSWELIKNEGLAQWLVTRDGVVAQYAEADALCYDSGEWNDDGPGIEIEFLDEPEGIFSDAARVACSGLIYWLNGEWGVPLDYYDGARLPEGTWQGFIAHGSLQQSQAHTDYWPRPDWDRMIAMGGPGTPVPVPPEDDDVAFTATDEDGQNWHFGGVWRRAITWDQANGLAQLAKAVTYEGHISNEVRDAYTTTED